MAEDTSYNGWSNRATWNVSLWLNNDEGLYNELMRAMRHAYSKDDAARRIKSLCEELWQDGKTPDGDLLSEADWEEIAASEYEEEQDEVEANEDQLIAIEKSAAETRDEEQDAVADFINEQQITFTRSWVPSRPDKLMDSPHMTRHFKCKIGKGRKSFTTYFSQGSAHTEPPTLADVLGCIIDDSNGYENAKGFEEWARDYDYDPDSRKAEKVYKTVKRQAEQLKRTIGEEAYTKLLGL